MEPTFTLRQFVRHVISFRRREWRIVYSIARSNGIRAAYRLMVTPYALG